MIIKNEQEYKKLQQELKEVSENITDPELRQKRINEIVKEMKNYCEFENDEVLSIIDKIKEKYTQMSPNEDVYDTFLTNGSYYFSYMLKTIFGEEAEIYTSTKGEIIGHSIVKIKDSFYDVSGKLDPAQNKEIYKKVNNEEFMFFEDLCKYGQSKDSIESFETKCNSVLNEILQEIQEENKKL